MSVSSVSTTTRVYDFMAYKTLKDSQKIGEVINTCRLDRGDDQRGLGKKIHKSAACISRWEKGSRKPDPQDVADVTLALYDKRPAENYCQQCPVSWAWRKVTDHLQPA